MSGDLLPPIPKQPMDPSRPESVAMWRRQFFDPLYRILGKASGMVWASINKTGSSLKDLETRKHSDLQSIEGWTSGTGTTQDQHISPLNGKKWEDHANATGVNHHGLDHDERYALKGDLSGLLDPDVTLAADSDTVAPTQKAVRGYIASKIDADDTMAADSDDVVPTQKAAKTYIDTLIAGLPEYVEDVWTPVLTAATPGDLSVSYSLRVGTVTRFGNRMTVNFTVNFTPTYTTATGAVRITDLPLVSETTASNHNIGAMYYTGLNKAGYSQVVARVAPNTQYIVFSCSGMGVAAQTLAITDLASGVAVQLTGTITYQVAA